MSAERHHASASTCGGVGPVAEFRDLMRASRAARARVPADVGKVVSACRSAERDIESILGRSLEGCDALEIGPGQWLSQARFFSRKARVTGIDLDVLPQGFDPAGYWSMFRSNGLRRVIKTLGRKALGFDRVFLREFDRQLGKPRFPPRLMRMDATKMTFPDATFDFAYSFLVMEHIPDPEAVFRECARVVKPGGCVYHNVHLYTCDSGAHDIRVISGDRAEVPYWAHIRPQHQHLVRYGGYVNKISLKDWMGIFERSFPGGKVSFIRDEELREEAVRLHRAGELKDYSLDDLLVHNMIVAWRRP